MIGRLERIRLCGSPSSPSDTSTDGFLRPCGRVGLGPGSKLLDTALVAVRDNGLDCYAQGLQQATTPPKVIVLGHTHHSEVIKTYANDGCWCHMNSQSYVVIEDGVASVVPY